MVWVEADSLPQAQPGFDAAVLTRCAIVVEQTLDPLAANFAVRAVGQDRGIFEWDVDLVVEAVGNPALDLLAAGATFIHRHVIRVMDMVEGAFGPQGGFEFSGGQRRVSHFDHSYNSMLMPS